MLRDAKGNIADRVKRHRISGEVSERETMSFGIIVIHRNPAVEKATVMFW